MLSTVCRTKRPLAAGTNALLVMSIVLCLISIPSDAKARGGARSEEIYAPAHIETLPLDIRRNLAKLEHACGSARAEHYFSVYLSPNGSPHSFVSLHFEHFRCDDPTAICTSAGCLHQVYVSAGERYRLVFEERVEELEFKIIGRASAIEISCTRNGENCSRILYWNGSRFIRRVAR